MILRTEEEWSRVIGKALHDYVQQYEKEFLATIDELLAQRQRRVNQETSVFIEYTRIRNAIRGLGKHRPK